MLGLGSLGHRGPPAYLQRAAGAVWRMSVRDLRGRCTVPDLKQTLSTRARLTPSLFPGTLEVGSPEHCQAHPAAGRERCIRTGSHGRSLSFRRSNGHGRSRISLCDLFEVAALAPNKVAAGDHEASQALLS
jgi:hypothetical protein